MRFSKSDYAVVTKSFDPILSFTAKAMDDSGIDWFVIAGWALDLFIGKKTREHKDIEISIWRDEASSLFKRFSNSRVDMVVGHKRYQALEKDSVIDKRGHLVIRNISMEGKSFDIELFTTERIDDHWIFRKQNDVKAPMDEAVLTAACGTRYLAPQYVLLYKSWFYPSMEQVIRDMPSEADFLRKCWETDCRDFQIALPLLSERQKQQLYQLLNTFTPGIPWLQSF